MKILLVDDNRDAAELQAQVLSFAGHIVAVATIAADALLLLRAGTWDALLADLVMPGMCGRELLEKAAAENILPPRVLVLTGRDDTEALEERGWRVLHKPTMPDELLAVLAEENTRQLKR